MQGRGGRGTCGIDVREDLAYADRKAPVAPMAKLSRMTGAKPPFPTKEGDTLSQYSIRAGLMAPIPAPYAQSEGRV
jgi:hypothetical protein